MPKIVEDYRDYIPPRCVRMLVEDLLKTVPPSYLMGLQTIILTNQAAQPRNKKQQKVWSRNRKIRLVDALGYYSPATRSARATIHLNIDNIVKHTHPGELGTPVLRYDPLARVLYHEIGHHIHAEHNPTYQGKENVAEDWSKRLSQSFYRTRYWYFYLLADSVRFLTKLSRSIGRRIRSVT